MRKRRGIFAYVIGALVLLCGCMAAASIFNRSADRGAQLATPRVTIFATQPATVVPTAIFEPIATDVPPTLTTAPTAAPLPTVEPATPTTQIDAPTALPVATEAPTEAPAPAVATEVDGSLSVPPSGADADGKNPFVDPPWLPCQQGQIKGSQTGKYHFPDGRFYKFTFSKVRCFNSEAEAQAAGFVMAQNQ
jgi:hypothetical protein